MSGSKHLLIGEHVETVSLPLISEKAPISVKAGQSVWDVTQEQMRALKLPTAEEIGAIREAAQREGFRAGEAAGLAAGQKQIQKAVQSLTAVLNQMANPLEQQAEATVLLMAELVQRLATAVVLRELKIDSSGITQVMACALAAVDGAQTSVTVRLHSQDVERIKAMASETVLDPGVKIVADQHIQPGGCLVESASGRVDASVASRLNQVLDQLYADLDIQGKVAPEAESLPPAT